MFKILLYYKLVEVDNPKSEVRKMTRLCQTLDIKGRILISPDANAIITGRCFSCYTATDEFTNCKNSGCNKLLLACDNCIELLNGTCSPYCQQVIIDPANIRPERVKVMHWNK